MKTLVLAASLFLLEGGVYSKNATSVLLLEEGGTQKMHGKRQEVILRREMWIWQFARKNVQKQV